MTINDDLFYVSPSGYQLILLEAWRRGLQVVLGSQGEYSISDASHNVIFKYTGVYENSSLLARKITKNKRITKSFLSLEAGMSSNLPKWTSLFLSSSRLDIKKVTEGLVYPLVLKSVNGSKGEGVYPNLKDESEVLEVLRNFEARNVKEALLEEHVFGMDCRFFIVGKECVSVTKRTPARVEGDGHSSVKELIALRNKALHCSGSGLIRLDEELRGFLSQQDKSADYVPGRGELVYLSSKNNTSRGGEATDVTKSCPDEIKKLAVKVIESLPGVSHGGVDIIIPDGKGFEPVVLEVNLTAEIGLQRFRESGKLIPEKIISHYFPGSKRVSSRVPWYFNWDDPQGDKTGKGIKLLPLPDDSLFRWRRLTLPYALSEIDENKVVNIARSVGVHGYVEKALGDIVLINIAGSPGDLDDFIWKLEGEVGNGRLGLFNLCEDFPPQESLVGFYIKTKSGFLSKL